MNCEIQGVASPIRLFQATERGTVKVEWFPLPLITAGQETALRIKTESWMLENSDLPRSGYVIFYRGKVSGWHDKIRDPNHNVPGCYAVPVQGGRIFKTVGGDESNGASCWVPVHSPSGMSAASSEFRSSDASSAGPCRQG